jgi:hypothetical protein
MQYIYDMYRDRDSEYDNLILKGVLVDPSESLDKRLDSNRKILITDLLEHTYTYTQLYQN